MSDIRHRGGCLCGDVVVEASGGPCRGWLGAPAHAFAFRPTIHVHYGEKVLAVRDGLPKYRDLHAAYGGSDETLPE